MSHLLISHSPDLKRLRDEGYEIVVSGGYLLIHHIPYVNKNREIKHGILVTDLTLQNNQRTAKPKTHVIHFIGDHPCNKDGSVITAIQHASRSQSLMEGITVNHSFSNKPKAGYADYYEKVVRYADIISAPAKSMDRNVTEKTFKVVTDVTHETVFHYLDTNSSRANIEMLNAKFKGQKIGIVGLGGTGAYVLDLVAKTHVQEIHLFDGDSFLQHNAFRSPGAPSAELLNQQVNKADHYATVYSNMHKHIQAHSYYLDESNVGELAIMTHVFICVDKNAVRNHLEAYLQKVEIPFIDVGLGVNVVDDCLIGSVRVTSGTPSKHDHISSRISAEDNDDNDYSTNVQIAELNALNAALAVIKWKKMATFYQDLEGEHHSVYVINTAQLVNEDITA